MMVISTIGRLFAPTRFPLAPIPDESRKMKAVFINRHGSADVMQYSDFPSPTPPPGSRQVLVDIVGAGLNPVDFKLRKGPIANFLYPKPKVIGSDMAGVVIEAPENSSFHPGQRVYAMLPFLGHMYGSYAERCCVEEDILVAAPSNHSLLELASIPLVATTIIQAMRPVKAAYGDSIKEKKCFIPAGSGGLGSFAIQYCANVLGMHVTTSCSSKNIELVKSLGAREVVDYNTEKIEDRLQDFDVFLDSMGYRYEELVLQPNSKILKPSTKENPSFYLRIASSPYGDKTETLSPDPLGLAVSEARLDRMIVSYSKQILGYFHLLPRGIQYYFILVSSEREALIEATEAIEKGKIRPVIQQSFPLAEAAQAHRLLEEGHVAGKLVLSIQAHSAK